MVRLVSSMRGGAALNEQTALSNIRREALDDFSGIATEIPHKFTALPFGA